MGSFDAIYGRQQLSGHANVPLITFTTIRGQIGRSDPDGGHLVPYIAGLGGTTLTFDIGGDTVHSFSVTFTSDAFADAIAAITAAGLVLSVQHVSAYDEDGYLRITS